MNFEPGLCRCCGSLTKHRFINEIYFINGHNKVYSEIVEECFGLKFCNLDSGPTERLICGLCAIKLQDAHAFKKQVEECEKAYVGKLYGIKVDNIPVAASIKVVKVTRVLPKPPPKKKPCVVIKKTENLASKVKLQPILPKPSSAENDCVEIKNTDNKGVRKIRIRKQYIEPGSSLLKGYDTSDEDTLSCNNDEQEVKMEIEEIVIPDDPIAVEQDFKIMAKNILDEVNQEKIVTEATNTQNNPISLDTIKETIKLEPEEFDLEEIKKEKEMALDVEEMKMINEEIKSENEEINVEENSIEQINEDQIELEEKSQLRRSTRFRKVRVQCEMKTPKIRKNRVQCERTTPNIIDKFNEEETLMAHIVVHDDALGMGPQSHVEEDENNLSGTDFSGSDDSEYIPQPEDTNNSAPSEKQADDDSDGSSDKDILYDSEEQNTSAPIFEKSEIPQTIEETEKTKDKKQSSPKKYKRKTYFCIFCKEPILNFARHIIRNHASQNDVQKIISYPKKSKIRKQLLTDLRKKGNYIRDAKNTQDEYLPCPFCLGYYKKKRLRLHRKKCDKKPEGKSSPSPAQVEGQNSLLRHLKIDAKLRNEVFPRMRADNVSLVAKKDPLICDFGAKYLKIHKEKYVINMTSRKMRELAKLLMEIRKIEPEVVTLIDALKPRHYDTIIKATKTASSYNIETDKLESTTYAVNIGTSIKQCANIALLKKEKYFKVETAEAATNLEILILLLNNWRHDISQAARPSQQ